MSSDVAIPTTAPTSPLRRFFASAIKFYHGCILLIVGFIPIWILCLTGEGANNTFWLAFALSAVVYFVCLVSIPQSYYELRPFEMDGRFYRRLGVRKFRYLVADGDGLQRLAQRIDPLWQCGLTKLSNEEWIERTRGIEWIKIALFGFTLPIIALAYSRGQPILASICLLLNIPFSIYPILLQRYTRAKLLRIAQVRNKRSASKNDLVSAATA